jgi:ABC-type polysaccharide/polyol phosphate export permease
MMGSWGPLLLFNPIGALLEALNDAIVLHARPDPFRLAYATVWAVPSFVVASAIFDRAEPLFAERV